MSHFVSSLVSKDISDVIFNLALWKTELKDAEKKINSVHFIDSMIFPLVHVVQCSVAQHRPTRPFFSIVSYSHCALDAYFDSHFNLKNK